MRQYDKPMTELNPSVVKEAKSESHFICNKICLIFFFKQHFEDVQYHCAYVLVFMFAGPVRMGMCDFYSLRAARTGEANSYLNLMWKQLFSSM